MRAFHRNHFGAMSQADRDTLTLKSSVRDGYMVYNLDTLNFERYDEVLGWLPVPMSGGCNFAGSFEQPVEPTVIQIPDGWWGFWWNTATALMWIVRNRSGLMYLVEMSN